MYRESISGPLLTKQTRYRPSYRARFYLSFVHELSVSFIFSSVFFCLSFCIFCFRLIDVHALLNVLRQQRQQISLEQNHGKRKRNIHDFFLTSQRPHYDKTSNVSSEWASISLKQYSDLYGKSNSTAIQPMNIGDSSHALSLSNSMSTCIQCNILRFVQLLKLAIFRHRVLLKTNIAETFFKLLLIDGSNEFPKSML